MNTDASSELESELNAEAQSVETDASEVQADPSSDSGENHEQKNNGVQERINKITAQKYEEKRRADELEAKLKQLESQKAVEVPVASDIKPPELPQDLYDDEAMRKYHADNIKYQQELASSVARKELENTRQEGDKAQATARQQELISKYAENAIKDGVDLDKLRGAEQALVNSGIAPELGNHLLSDPNGAKIVEYLADNPGELYEVASMDPVSAGIHIATKVKPKALSTTPKVSGAPDPIPTIKGGGVVEVDEFDKTYPGAEFF